MVVLDLLLQATIYLSFNTIYGFFRTVGLQNNIGAFMDTIWTSQILHIALLL